MEVGDWVHKYALSLQKTKKDSVIFTTENSSLLAVDNACGFVPILCEDHFHVFMWEDGVRLHC